MLTATEGIKMATKKIQEEIELPQGVQANIEGLQITIKGPKGEVKRKISNPLLIIKKEGNSVIVTAEKSSKKEKKEINTYVSHIKNMINGATKGHYYELKICSGHFPMNVSIAGGELIIKNFIGEKNPRKLKIKAGVTVKVEGEKVTVEHSDIEIAGQTAADIEQLTRRPGFDPRIFQDGIYITKKDGKELTT